MTTALGRRPAWTRSASIPVPCPMPVELRVAARCRTLLESAPARRAVPEMPGWDACSCSTASRMNSVPREASAPIASGVPCSCACQGTCKSNSTCPSSTSFRITFVPRNWSANRRTSVTRMKAVSDVYGRAKWESVCLGSAACVWNAESVVRSPMPLQEGILRRSQVRVQQRRR
nr:uncharacterized protein LOC118878096 isoform X1 [Drosophila suzukii]